VTRTYVQRARADAVAQTRRAILAATRTVLVSADRLDVSVGAIADAAGVARSTIYAAFGTRAGLLAALARKTLAGAGLGDVIAAYRQPDAVTAVESSIRANCRMYATDHLVLARLAALAAVDPEAAAPIKDLERERDAATADLAARLAAQGRLRPGLSVDRAAHVLSVVTSFSAFDELHARRGLDHDACADVLVDVVRSTLGDPRPPAGG